MLRKTDLPEKKKTANGKMAQTQMLTLRNLEYVLEKMKVTVRFNVMTAAAHFEAENVGQDEHSQDTLRELIKDTLLKLDISALGRFDELMSVLARRDMYHPMEEWIRAGGVWDGRDRIRELATTVQTETRLWPVFLENWLVQVVEAVCGWRRTAPFSLPYVLVFVGGQGVGKTRWFANLGGQWIKTEAELHLSSVAGKDHQIDVLRWPMAELSELDGIFRKADVSHMKAFISREADSIRAPYERKALKRPRMTVFCGSVNEAEFLNDSTGSRRFWPVAVDSITWSFDMDWRQLWAQALAYWEEDAAFDLSADEEQERGRLAVANHTLRTAEAEKIAEYYRRHHGHPNYPDVAMNRTEILEMLYGKGRSFSPKQISDAGKVLADLSGKHRTIDGKQRSWMFPFNEFATDLATWPDKNHLKSV